LAQRAGFGGIGWKIELHQRAVGHAKLGPACTSVYDSPHRNTLGSSGLGGPNSLLYRAAGGDHILYGQEAFTGVDGKPLTYPHASLAVLLGEERPHTQGLGRYEGEDDAPHGGANYKIELERLE
jgi:hypothetical protein